jgi:putative ABC transport system permease protein
VTVAGYTAGQRANQVPRGKYIAFVSILVGTAITMILLLMLKVFPFTPRYIIPAAGLMVGNAMTVTGIAMKKLQEDVTIQKNQVSYYTSPLATWRHAMRHLIFFSLAQSSLFNITK